MKAGTPATVYLNTCQLSLSRAECSFGAWGGTFCWESLLHRRFTSLKGQTKHTAHSPSHPVKLVMISIAWQDTFGAKAFLLCEPLQWVTWQCEHRARFLMSFDAQSVLMASVSESPPVSPTNVIHLSSLTLIEVALFSLRNHCHDHWRWWRTIVWWSWKVLELI